MIQTFTWTEKNDPCMVGIIQAVGGDLGPHGIFLEYLLDIRPWQPTNATQTGYEQITQNPIEEIP